MAHNFNQLKKTILRLSITEDWEEARREWEVVSTYHDPDSQCTCGKQGIAEVNIIENKWTGEQLPIGSKCVQHFLLIKMHTIHANIKKIQKDPFRSLNRDTIYFFYRLGVINEASFKFYNDIFRKRNLSVKQERWRYSINLAVLNFVNQSKKEALSNKTGEPLLTNHNS